MATQMLFASAKIKLKHQEDTSSCGTTAVARSRAGQKTQHTNLRAIQMLKHTSRLHQMSSRLNIFCAMHSGNSTAPHNTRAFK
jgi:hypothetical protein